MQDSILTASIKESSKGGDFPSGIICMWSGSTSTIPSGWAICNGQNGTPNLQGLFIMGAGGSYTVGAKGGAAQVTLSMSQMPSHRHSVSDSDTGVTSISGSGSAGCATSGSGSHTADVITAVSASKSTVDIRGDVNYTGSASPSPHNNLPPYYALYYIMKL